jgi:hypothetical protein
VIESKEDKGLGIPWFIFSFFWGTLLWLLGPLYFKSHLDFTDISTRDWLIVISMYLGFITAMLVYPKEEKK